jgi:hypothetical protein
MHAIICADSISFFALFFFKKKEKSEIEQLNLGEERSKLGLVVGVLIHLEIIYFHERDRKGKFNSTEIYNFTKICLPEAVGCPFACKKCRKKDQECSEDTLKTTI